ncbi:hypothetical protein GCM10011410_25250 [Hoyosella rhizosphaerae]|uniref:Uncharacterized protein n=1 Tax=Hoyosella rhizosphaerae TaxID=1755582 RepID=A0A916XHQ1_9ACTN|nr:hypothetical protein GCM10011410_25250 [Hoyosella rhizosphaerae]
MAFAEIGAIDTEWGHGDWGLFQSCAPLAPLKCEMRRRMTGEVYGAAITS